MTTTRRVATELGGLVLATVITVAMFWVAGL